MLANFHTHTSFCDGCNTPEEIVAYAIDKGFDALGFSGHGYTGFDLEYCMRETQAYILTINQLKEKYKDKIQIYLGIEEDAFSPVNRTVFDYIIGSSHYVCVNGQYYPIDSDFECFKTCLELFDGDAIRLAEVYYKTFCDYILARKPDIVGHFDLITKYDEMDGGRFLSNSEYLKIAEKYLDKALESGCVFEVNTGAIAKGLRTAPYPCERLLYLMKKRDGKIMLSSDSHRMETLDFHFERTKEILRSIGFTDVYVIYDGGLRQTAL